MYGQHASRSAGTKKTEQNSTTADPTRSKEWISSGQDLCLSSNEPGDDSSRIPVIRPAFMTAAVIITTAAVPVSRNRYISVNTAKDPVSTYADGIFCCNHSV